MKRITPATAPIRVYLIDNHRLLRAAMRHRLTRRGRFTVVGSRDDVHSAMDEMRAVRPDVLVLDLLMPGMIEMEAMSYVQHELPDLPIVIVTHYADERTIARAMGSGARAYVSKDAEEIELMLALESACSGVPFVSPRLVTSHIVGPLFGYRSRPASAHDSHAPDARAADARATEARAIDERATDERATDERATDGRVTDGRVTDGRVTDGRVRDPRESGARERRDGHDTRGSAEARVAGGWAPAFLRTEFDRR